MLFEVTIARLDNASLLFEKIIARLDKLSFTLTFFLIKMYELIFIYYMNSSQVIRIHISVSYEFILSSMNSYLHVV